MNATTVPFDVSRMDGKIPDGIDFLWKGCEVNSGPLDVSLDDLALDEDDNHGELDYASQTARARFCLKLEFSDQAKRRLGALSPELTQPIRAALDSEGRITESHNFGMSGPMEVQAHPFFEAGQVRASVLPGH